MSDTEEGYNWIKIGDTTKGADILHQLKKR